MLILTKYGEKFMGQQNPIIDNRYLHVTQEDLDNVKPASQLLEEGIIKDIKIAKLIFREKFPRKSSIKH